MFGSSQNDEIVQDVSLFSFQPQGKRYADDHSFNGALSNDCRRALEGWSECGWVLRSRVGCLAYRFVPASTELRLAALALPRLKWPRPPFSWYVEISLYIKQELQEKITAWRWRKPPPNLAAKAKRSQGRASTSIIRHSQQNQTRAQRLLVLGSIDRIY